MKTTYLKIFLLFTQTVIFIACGNIHKKSSSRRSIHNPITNIDDDLDHTEDSRNKNDKSGDKISKVENSSDGGNQTIWPNHSFKSHLSDATLIIYNRNAVDAREIAEYYAQKRKIPSGNICAVSIRPGLYGSDSDLGSAHKQIIRNCLCPLVAGYFQGEVCDETKTTKIAAHSPIKFIANVKGMPARLTTMPNWSGMVGAPSFDYYLAHLLYKPQAEVFNASSGSIAMKTKRPNETIVPATDRYVAYGRIEAMNLERTKKLIDRTIEGELRGINQALMVTSASDPTLAMIRQFYGATSNECKAHLDGGAQWNGCQVAKPSDGRIPIGSNVAKVINAGIFLGSNPYPNGHQAFNGDLNKMLGWRKTAEDCVTLCRDFKTEIEKNQCRAESDDYFKEINTKCVGTAPGFLGQQIRSYPVGYYGFQPKGWLTPAGPTLDMPPTLLDGGGFKSAEFTDDKFIRYGGSAAANASDKCKDGLVEYDCTEELAFHIMSHNLSFDKWKVGQPFSAKLRFRYRYTGGNNNGWLVIRIYATPSTGKAIEVGKAIGIISSPTNWQTFEEQLSFAAESLATISDIKYLQVSINSAFGGKTYKSLDLDGIELIHENTNYMPKDWGSFYAEQIGNFGGGGDYAANMIDRMGAVAWWGSSSHFLTGGWAFSNHTSLFSILSAGNTLGEAIASAGGWYSGIFYGDPIYVPFRKNTHQVIRLQVYEKGQIVDKEKIVEKNALAADWDLFGHISPAVGKNANWSFVSCLKSTAEECTANDWQVVSKGSIGKEEFLHFGKLAELMITNARVFQLRVDGSDDIKTLLIPK